MKTNRREAIASLFAIGAGVLVASSDLLKAEAQSANTQNKSSAFKFTNYTALTYNFDGLKGLDKDMLEQHYS
ncbi:MAG: hypothetical protein ACK419_04755, partial [Pyrinomonadaceae bacterium]